MTPGNTADAVLRTPYQRSVAEYWNVEKDPVNLRLGDVDGLYHHHYGIGAVDWSVLDTPQDRRDERIIAELHRLESAQANFLLDHLGPIQQQDRLLDSGCGRGGSSIMANERFGCYQDGISISQQQVEFANNQARLREVQDKVRFHFRNMLDTGFDAASFQAIWNNESTMYVDLNALFSEYARIIKPGGRYVTITGASNDTFGLPSKSVCDINARYICDIHPRSEYFRAMAANGFVPITVVDL
ncbi:MAG TPA: geranyl diphosphate 2-C-methyltransferase, partial [Actinospica sp.]|nr:geranyl diphosphate 2-C-methyltransferase [Actinospica sp.]